MANQKVKKQGARKSTIRKYSAVIANLKTINKPTKIDASAFGKKHKVSNNMISLLVGEGYLIRTKAGFRWAAKHAKSSDTVIAKVIATKLYESINRYGTPKSRNKNKVLKPAAPAKTKNTDSDRIALAKKFAKLGDYAFADELLG